METQKRIFVAVDEETRDFFVLMFTNLGYETVTAPDGQSAFEKIKKTCPDLIMVSTVLPKLSGWELLSKVKNDEALKMIPVVLLSDIADVKDKVDAFEHGAGEYISKPFNFPEVLARIRSLLRTGELFRQLSVRESRLALAETLHAGLKEAVELLIKDIDNLDEAVARAKGGEEQAEGAPKGGFIRDKITSVRSGAVALNERLDKTMREWDILKRQETALSAFGEGQRGA